MVEGPVGKEDDDGQGEGEGLVGAEVYGVAAADLALVILPGLVGRRAGEGEVGELFEVDADELGLYVRLAGWLVVEVFDESEAPVAAIWSRPAG